VGQFVARDRKLEAARAGAESCSVCSYANSQPREDDHALKCRMNLELKKSRMVNKRSHYSLPEFLISRWKRDVD